MRRRSPGQSSLCLSQLAARRAASRVTNAVFAASFAGLNAAVPAQRPSHRIAHRLGRLRGGEAVELAGHRSCDGTRQRGGKKMKAGKDIGGRCDSREYFLI